MPESESQRPQYHQVFKEIRESLGLSQTTLSLYLGISEPQISRIENAKRLPPRRESFYKRLSEIPGVSLDQVRRLVFSEGGLLLLIRDVDPNPLEWQIADTASGPIKFKILDVDEDIFPSEDLQKITQAVRTGLEIGGFKLKKLKELQE